MSELVELGLRDLTRGLYRGAEQKVPTRALRLQGDD